MSIAGIPGWDELRPHELRSWVVDTLHHAQELASGKSVHLGTFRVRIHGLLGDVAGAVRNHPELEELNRALAALRGLFTDDETWCLQYLRDMECHPLRRSYERPVTNRITGTRLQSEEFEQVAKRATEPFVDEGELLRVIAEPSFMTEAGKRIFERATIAFARRAVPALQAIAGLPWPDRL